MSRDLESFERGLKDAGDWRNAFRVALKGLVNNKFTRSLREIDKTNLPTLEIRNPETYETIKDRRVREALIISGLFQVARHRGPRAVEDLEIFLDVEHDRLLRAIIGLTERRKSAIPSGGWSEQPYAGGEAAKVFLRALHAVISDIQRDEGKRFNDFHNVAHGRDSRYGTPLDEIRISTMGKRLPLEKTSRMLKR